MASNLQVMFKQFKTSVNNMRLVAESLLSATSSNQYIITHKGQSENVLFSANKLSDPRIVRLPLPHKINLAEMKKFPTKRHHDINASSILPRLLQAGFPTSLQQGSEKSLVGTKVQGVHNNYSRKENTFALNDAVLTKASLTLCQFQWNIRSYSTGSSENKEDIATSKVSSETVYDCKNVPTSRKEKLKQAMKDYGSTVVIFYIGISLISFGCFYLLVSSGLDIVAILQHFGWENSALSNKLATGASTLVVAYAVHMLFASVRISITLAATPFIVRHLRNKGFLKKPSSSEKK